VGAAAPFIRCAAWQHGEHSLFIALILVRIGPVNPSWTTFSISIFRIVSLSVCFSTGVDVSVPRTTNRRYRSATKCSGGKGRSGFYLEWEDLEEIVMTRIIVSS
jgi:hypothetical protein